MRANKESYKQEARKHKKSYCELCFTKRSTNNKPLDIHHIDKNYKNNDDTNLVTLCRRCHYVTHVTMYELKPIKRGRETNKKKIDTLYEAIKSYNNLYK